jgi:phosphoglycerol transferase MdoB-like AlkP superfamily enzyme
MAQGVATETHAAWSRLARSWRSNAIAALAAGLALAADVALMSWRRDWLAVAALAAGVACIVKIALASRRAYLYARKAATVSGLEMQRLEAKRFSDGLH